MSDRIKPDHYVVKTRLKILGCYVQVECDEITEALGLDHYTASAFEYLFRSRRKGNELEDLEKARSRITDRINQLNHEMKLK